MKKKTCLSVYIALLFLIFLVVLFPYKEGFAFKTIFDKDVQDLSYNDISGTNIRNFS
jgi:hypothetical protein